MFLRGRQLEVLRCIGNTEARMPDLAKKWGIKPQSARHRLHYLEKKGFVVQTTQGKGYVSTFRLTPLGMAALESAPE